MPDAARPIEHRLHRPPSDAVALRRPIGDDGADRARIGSRPLRNLKTRTRPFFGDHAER